MIDNVFAKNPPFFYCFVLIIYTGDELRVTGLTILSASSK